MTQTSIEFRAAPADVGGACAFIEKIQSDQRAARTTSLVRKVTDERPALTMIWLLGAATVISCGFGWLVAYLHLS